MCKSISILSSFDCTVYAGTYCTLYDGLSPFFPRRHPKKSKKEKIRIKKVVHYIPESVVQYVPDSIVHYIPKYSLIKDLYNKLW